MVLLDATRPLAMTRGRLLLHERGTPWAWPTHPTAEAATWGAGDLAGLHAVGRSAGCLHAGTALTSRP